MRFADLDRVHGCNLQLAFRVADVKYVLSISCGLVAGPSCGRLSAPRRPKNFERQEFRWIG